MKTQKHKSDLVILVLTITLMVIGLIVIYAIGPMRANVLNLTYGTDYDSGYFFRHQLMSVGLALAAFLVAFKVIPYDKTKKLAKIMLILGILASVLLWILAKAGSSMAKCELGECRWLNIAGISFQPAELLKLSLVLYLADFLIRKKESGTIGEWRDFWVPLIIVAGIVLGLVVVAQGDLGSGITLLAIIIGMLFVAGLPIWQYLLMIVIITVGGVLAITTSEHRMERIDAWVTVLNDDSSESTYHIENAMLAIGTGGFWGVGIGNSVQATGYLPESINDSIFAIMGETFGFVGLCVVMLIFAIMLFRILNTASRTVNFDERLIVIGIFSWVMAQVILNVSAMTSLVPVTGVTLPLLSYGGTSMIFTAFGLGLVLQISCYTSREVIQDEDIDSRRRIGGTRYSGRSRRP